MKFDVLSRKILALILSVAIIATGLVASFTSFATGDWDGSAATAFKEGSGTVGDPYLISTPEELKLAVTSKGVTDSGSKLYYKMTDDIYLNDVTVENWKTNNPIEWGAVKTADFSAETAFHGVFDGNGYTVYGLYVTESYAAPEGTTADRSVAAGLFPVVGAGAIIKNVGIDQAHFALTNNHATAAIAYAGQVGLVGYAYNSSAAAITLDRCFIGENVTMKAVFAGLVGDLKTSTPVSVVLTNCYAVPSDVTVFEEPDRKYIYENRFMLAGGRDNSAGYKLDYCYSVGNLTFTGAGATDTKFNYCTTWTSNTLGKGFVANIKGDAAFENMPGLNTQNAYVLTDSYPILKVFQKAGSNTWSGAEATPTALDDDGNVIISTPEELAYVIKNGGGSSYVLTNDIYINNLKKVDWKTGEPAIGYSPKSWYTTENSKPFTGSIDGKGHTVYGLYYKSESVSSSYGSSSVALIPKVENAEVTIKNLGVDSSYIKYTNNAAGIIGTGSSTKVRTIDNCYVGENTTIIGEVAGGIFGGGDASLNISNCYSLATLGAATKNGGILGGTWRYTYSGVSTQQTVINCYSTAKLYGNSAASTASNVYGEIGENCKGQQAIKNFPLGEPFCATKDSYPTLRVFAGLTNLKDWNGLGIKEMEGSGTESDPYIVENAGQLAYVSYTGGGHHYKMVKDIYVNDVKKTDWQKNENLRSWIYEETKFGTGGYQAPNKRFKGTFDGNGYVVHGLWYPFEEYTPVAALFLSAQDANLKNIGIKNSYINAGYTKQYAIDTGYATEKTAADAAGGIASGIVGWMQSVVKISGCFADSTVYLENYSDGNLCASAGIAGYTMSTSEQYAHKISDCWSAAQIKSGSTNKQNGILGSSWTSRYYSTNTLSIDHTPYQTGKNVSSLLEDAYKNNYSNFGTTCAEYTVLSNEQLRGENALDKLVGFSPDVWYAVTNDQSEPALRIHGVAMGDVDENGVGKNQGDIIALRKNLIGAESWINTDFDRNGKTDICDLVSMNTDYKPSIIFNANGGMFAGSKTQITVEQAIGSHISVETPILKNYGVLGWSLTPDGEILESDLITAELDGKTLYAIWVEVSLEISPVFRSNMVLQRNKPICVYGTGKGVGEITIGNQTKQVNSTTDTWEVYFEPMEASTTPVTFKTNFNGIVSNYKNVLVGDVYIASGQSNMEFTLKATEQTGTVESNSLLRFAYRGTQGWYEFKPDVVESATAIGVLFAQELSYALENEIPIGIISCSKGASRIDDWIHEDYCFCEEYDFDNTAHSDYTKYDQGHHDLYRNQIQPIEKLTTAGVLWYQGESNRGIGEAYRYLDMFKTFVECWRTRMDDPTLPFYTVQIMLYQNNNTYDMLGKLADEYNIRIAQGEAARTMDGVTVCTMLSYEDTLAANGTLDIHPTDKLPIAKALVNAVLTTYYNPLGDYDKTPEYSGPLYKEISVSGGKATITFDHIAEGLMLTKGSTINDLEVRNADGSWVAASGTLSGNVVTVTAEGVSEITGVRMGYMNRPDINLYNTIGGVRGYCASPFKWSAE